MVPNKASAALLDSVEVKSISGWTCLLRVFSALKLAERAFRTQGGTKGQRGSHTVVSGRSWNSIAQHPSLEQMSLCDQTGLCSWRHAQLQRFAISIVTTRAYTVVSSILPSWAQPLSLLWDIWYPCPHSWRNKWHPRGGIRLFQ